MASLNSISLLYSTPIGSEIPKGKILDGKNIWTALEKNEAARAGEMIYVLRHREGYSDVGARQDEWKILREAQNKWQLFNIEKDISEQNDLSAEHPEKLKEMVAKAEKWSQSHLQLLWFHDEETGEQWRADKMPHFEKTFKID